MYKAFDIFCDRLNAKFPTYVYHKTIEVQSNHKNV